MKENRECHRGLGCLPPGTTGAWRDGKAAHLPVEHPGHVQDALAELGERRAKTTVTVGPFLSPGRAWRREQDVLPHSSHLHLPLCPEAAGPSLRGYLARPPEPRKQRSRAQRALPSPRRGVPATCGSGEPPHPKRQGPRWLCRPGTCCHAAARTMARNTDTDPPLPAL